MRRWQQVCDAFLCVLFFRMPTVIVYHFIKFPCEETESGLRVRTFSITALGNQMGRR